MAQVSQTRELLMQMLLRVSQEEHYSHLVLRETLEKYQFLPKKDRAFITRAFEGTIENRIKIDYWIDQVSSVKVNKMKPVIREIIRSAVYQIVYMDSVPDSAACNEAVKLAQKKGFFSLKGFVNGVLRNISRIKDNLPLPPESMPKAYLSVRYSTPEWLVDKWLRVYGEDTTEKILRDFLKDKPTTVRLRTFATNTEQTEKMLRDEGVTVTKAPYVDAARYISGYDYVPGLTAFREGRMQVQDVSSMLVSVCAAPKKGDMVLDLCAAPGGKSLHMADLLQGSGSVEARDLTDYKVDLIRSNIERSGAINIEAVRHDATVYDRRCEGRYDIVLADVPCSGLGVIGKKTDIKYRMDPDKIRELVQLQRQILHNAAAYVKPGGVLMFSTCTICAEENERNVSWFTSHYPFHTESLDPWLPDELCSAQTREGMLQLLPGIHRSDGFFLARLKKEEDHGMGL